MGAADAADVASAAAAGQPPARRQVSAIERLQSLPALFRGSDLTVRFQWTSKTASQYLYLWRQRGLVEGLGGHSDVYANRLVQPSPDWETALAMAMPTAILIGVDALRRAGWSTQIPARPEVAVSAGDLSYRVEPFDVRSRPAGWRTKVAPGLVGSQPASLASRSRSRSRSRAAAEKRPVPALQAGLPVLRPAWALADMLDPAGGGGWGVCGLTPDDLEFGEASDADAHDWLAACSELKLGDDLRDQVVEMGLRTACGSSDEPGEAPQAIQRERAR